MFLRIAIFCFSLLATASSLFGQTTIPIEFDGDLKPVQDLTCDEMQSMLRDEIFKNPKWKRLVESKRMAIGMADLEDLDHVNYAGLNDNHMMYAASLPKIAILLASEDAFEKGTLTETPELQQNLKMMISKSSNQAATKMIDLLGYENIENSLRQAKHSLYDESTGGGLWVGKRYASTGKRYPDPLTGLSHGATASQAVSFYYQLVFGHLINKDRSAKMLEVLKDPTLTHKFVNTLNKIAPKAKVYRKSGSWRNYHSDSVLVWGPQRKYILVALIEDPSGEQIIRDLVEPLERVMKQYKPVRCL